MSFSSIEFILAGHSHMWAMGAPRGYKGPRGLVCTEAYGHRGYYVLETDGGPRTRDYWKTFMEASTGRDAIVVWAGNEHFTTFLFEQTIRFDLVDERGAIGLDAGRVLVPRRIVRSHFESHAAPLRALLRSLRKVGAKSVTVVGTPPPQADMSAFERRVRGSTFWKDLAVQHGVDLATAQLTPASIMLKLWRVTQDLFEEAALAAEGRFVAVPDSMLDQNGFLADEYRIVDDFTHANDNFGQIMLRLALQA